MKFQLTLIVGAACALTSVAIGQPAKDQPSGVQLRDIPSIGELFRAPSASPRVPLERPQRDKSSLFGAQFSPIPQLDPAQPAGTRVQVLQVEGAEITQVEIVRQSIAEALKEITTLMGARAVIDPQLEQEQLETRVLRARDWDELLRSFGEAVEVVKSPEGTYFFAARPVRLSGVSYTRMPDGTYQRTEFFTRSRELPQTALDKAFAPQANHNPYAVPRLVAPGKTER